MLLAASRPPEPFDPPGLDIFEPPPIWSFDLFGLQFDITRVTLYMFLAAAIVIVLFVLAASRPGLVPRGVRNVVELIVEFVREQIALQVIGREGLPWVPFLTAMFMFILVGNLFEVIPGIQFPITSKMAIPAFLAGVTWIIFNAVGFRAQGGRYLVNTLFPPGVPKAMYILLTPIEFISVFLVRPFTLSVRLLANMIAGHLILTIFFVGAVYLILSPPIGWLAGVPAFALGTALIAFEILVSILQAYIFTILTAVYIAGAVHPEH
ncbi:MAG TPA: F0F1 ATP synthase subunit A [Actinomycetota bacterium]|nr:F0F1 ATP synthase subunit A [Actinomycetota bacterium]